MPDDLHARVIGAGVRLMALSAEDALAVADLPLHHRDPFARLLVAQARRGGWTLVSADARLRACDVPVLDPLA